MISSNSMIPVMFGSRQQGNENHATVEVLLFHIVRQNTSHGHGENFTSAEPVSTKIALSRNVSRKTKGDEDAKSLNMPMLMAEYNRERC